jgi:sphingosine kinase/centromere protein J
LDQVIPGGSGNGLSASLLHRSGERLDALNAAYALAKGSASELDLATVMNGKQDVVYSFLSLEWAFIADVDIESERYRMFGGMRFTISSVAKLLARHKRYSGTLRYLSSDFDVPGAPPKYHERLSHQEEGASRPALECLPVVDEKDSSPSQWREVSGQFHMFWGMNVSHASSDGHIAPNAPIDDGYYYLMLMDGSFSRMSLTKMLLGLDDGSHIGQKQVQLIRTRAFTLHVDNPTDLLCVDGELFDGPDIQVCVCSCVESGFVLCDLGSESMSVCFSRLRCIVDWAECCVYLPCRGSSPRKSKSSSRNLKSFTHMRDSLSTFPGEREYI